MKGVNITKAKIKLPSIAVVVATATTIIIITRNVTVIIIIYKLMRKVWPLIDMYQNIRILLTLIISEHI